MMRRMIRAGLAACLFACLLLASGQRANAQAPGGAAKPATPAKPGKPAKPAAATPPAPAPVNLPPSKLNICQYGFAYAQLRVPTQKLKVESNSNPGVLKAKNGPQGRFIILIAGKNYGDSVVTFSGEMRRGNAWVPFTQKLTVSVVSCKKPKPPGKGGGGPVAPDGPQFSVDKKVCKGDSYYYTLNIRAPDGSNSLVHVSVKGDAVASANYDPASQTVSGVGLKAGEHTKIPVKGEVEAVDENIPFEMEINVFVLDCKKVQVCMGANAAVNITNGAAATSANRRIATAGMAGGNVQIHGVNAGSTVVSATNANGDPVGRIDVLVKKCPPPKKRGGGLEVPPVEHRVRVKRKKTDENETKKPDKVDIGISIGIGIGGGGRRGGDRRDDDRGGGGGIPLGR